MNYPCVTCYFCTHFDLNKDYCVLHDTKVDFDAEPCSDFDFFDEDSPFI